MMEAAYEKVRSEVDGELYLIKKSVYDSYGDSEIVRIKANSNDKVVTQDGEFVEIKKVFNFNKLPFELQKKSVELDKEILDYFKSK